MSELYSVIFRFNRQKSTTDAFATFTAALLKGTNTMVAIHVQSSINLGETLANKARMKNRTYQDQASCLYVYHLSDFCLNLLNGYDFYF